MPGFAKRFLRSRSGATAIEYAMIAAFIAMVLVTALGLIGTRLAAILTSVSSAFT
jgi:pilus assembly protein Flp/PilA